MASLRNQILAVCAGSLPALPVLSRVHPREIHVQRPVQVRHLRVLATESQRTQRRGQSAPGPGELGRSWLWQGPVLTSGQVALAMGSTQHAQLGSGSMARQGGPRDGAGRVRSRRRSGNPQTRLGTTASSARVRRTCWTTRSPTPRRFPGPTSAHGSSATTSTRWTRTWPRNGGSAAPSGPRRLCSRSSWPASRWLGLGSSAGCRLLLVFAARMCKWSADSWRCAGGSLGVAALLSPERAPQPLDLPACCSGSGEAGGLGRHTRSLVRFLRRHAREREPAKARYQVQKKDWGKVSRFLIAMAGTTSYAKTQSKTANRHRGQTGAGKKSTGKGAGKSAGRSKAGSLAACTASSGCSRHTGTRSTGWFFVRGAE